MKRISLAATRLIDTIRIPQGSGIRQEKLSQLGGEDVPIVIPSTDRKAELKTLEAEKAFLLKKLRENPGNLQLKEMLKQNEADTRRNLREMEQLSDLGRIQEFND